MNCPTNLLPENLPQDFVQAAAVCITIQAFDNTPCHVQAIYDGLYGDAVDPEAAKHQLTLLLAKMVRVGLITMPSKSGTVILTDKGDEAASTFRALWVGSGILDLSDLC
jgi:hypothetical protein